MNKVSNKCTSLSVAVLAGGASSRMGQDKSLLSLHGEYLISRVVTRINQLSDDIMVITNNQAKYNFLQGKVRFISDITGPGQGPLAGIASALEAAQHERVLIVATDMPFLNVSLLAHLAQLDDTVEVIVPVIAEDGYPETLHAIYSKRALPAITAQLATGRRKITRFFRDVQVRYVPRHEIEPFDPLFRSFFNANTPQEWEEVEQLAGK